METLARLGRDETPMVRFACEAVARAMHIDTWEQSWDIVKRVDDSLDLGLCLDTFHIAARGWGDPIYASSRTDTADKDLGRSYSSWVSSEMFSRELCKEDPTIPEEYAQRGQQSWKSLLPT